jgi:hypothetical protein
LNLRALFGLPEGVVEREGIPAMALESETRPRRYMYASGMRAFALEAIERRQR